MKQEIQTAQEITTPYSTVGKDLQAALLIVSLIANLFVFIAWLAYELSK